MRKFNLLKWGFLCIFCMLTTIGWADTDPDDGILAVTVNGDEVSFTSSSNVYYSVTIPEEAGTLTISSTSGDLVENLYTNADCTDGQVGGTYDHSWSDEKSSWITSYSYTGLTPSTTYYGYINGGGDNDIIYATYEVTGTTDYNITLVSPTADDISGGLAKLEEGYTIKITAENLTSDNAIMLDVYSTDEDNPHPITLQYFTEDENNSGTYTWTAGTDYELTKGITYTFYATPYSSEHQGSALSEAVELFKVEGTASHTVATLTAEPATGSTITTNGSDQTITLTFNQAVIVTKYQISLGQGNYETIIPDDNTDASTTWTLTITDTQLNNDVDEDSKLSIIIYATDADGNTVYAEDGTSYFELDYTVEPGVTLPSSWSDIQIKEITTEEGKSLNEFTTSDSNILVTFEDTNEDAADVTVITDENAEYYSYVTIGDDDTKYAVTATKNDVADDTEDTEAASSWTITIPEEVMTAVAEIVETSEIGSLTVVIVAQDENGNYVKSSTQTGFPTFDCAVSAPSKDSDETPYTFTSDPFSGETVESLSTFTVQIDGEDDDAFIELADEDNISAIKVYAVDEDGNATGDAFAKVSSYEPLVSEETDNKYGVTFSLDTTIEENGDYVIVIPEGFFYCGSLTNLSNEIDIHVTVKQPVEYSLIITPADGDEVTSLSSITIEEANQQELTWGELDETDIEVLDSSDQPVAYGVNHSTWEDGHTLTLDNGDEYGYVIDLNPTITTAGTYTIVIPEELIMYGDYDATKGNEVIKITVTIADEEGGDGTGINSISLQSTSGNVIYNLNGQRVSTPSHGVYILNGKKILIK